MYKRFVFPLTFFVAGIPGLAFASCPSMEGTYQVEGSPYKFYIQHTNDKNKTYKLIFEAENDRYIEKTSMSISEEQRKKERLPECALLIPEVGMLMKAEKGEKIDVLNQSQNYTNQKTLTGDYVLWVFGGFSVDAININKLSDASRVDKKLTLQPEEDSDPDQTRYRHELALAADEAKNNHAAAQLFMAKNSSLVKYGFDANGAGFWYARNSDAETRQYWLDKALRNNYGPAWCFQAATQEHGDFKFDKTQRIAFYEKAFSKGNAPLAGVYLADLTTDSKKKTAYLIGAVNQGSFVAIWRLAALSEKEKSQLPDNIQAIIKNPPMERLKAEIPSVYKTYIDSASSYFNVTGKDWRKDVYIFPMEKFISENQSYGKTGADLDYNQSRTDCIEREVVYLADYPQ
ncbi:TPA: hypothetical protein M4K80_003566 [Salmonella enterica]|nr:hypothetical protein [Salmonella enterica]